MSHTIVEYLEARRRYGGSTTRGWNSQRIEKVVQIDRVLLVSVDKTLNEVGRFHAAHCPEVRCRRNEIDVPVEMAGQRVTESPDDVR